MIIRTNKYSFVEARIKKGFSQHDLAREAEMSQPYISQIESGDRNPSPKRSKALCEVLDVEFDQIFFIEIDSNSKQKVR